MPREGAFGNLPSTTLDNISLVGCQAVKRNGYILTFKDVSKETPGLIPHIPTSMPDPTCVCQTVTVIESRVSLNERLVLEFILFRGGKHSVGQD